MPAVPMWVNVSSLYYEGVMDNKEICHRHRLITSPLQTGVRCNKDPNLCAVTASGGVRDEWKLGQKKERGSGGWRRRRLVGSKKDEEREV